MYRLPLQFSAILVAGIMQLGAHAACHGAEPVTAELYQAPDGNNYAAMGIRLPEAGAALTPDQLLILVDTSASQLGEYRTQSLKVLGHILQANQQVPQVNVWAIDVSATQLLPQFSKLNPESIQSITAQLDERIPAGSTDLATALENGLAALNTSGKARIIYIGDGFSAGNLIDATRLQELVGTLAERQIPVISYALGSQVDHQLLGTLALRSGGRVITDLENSEADKIAAQIVAATNSQVWYPERVSAGKGVQLYPQVALPVRSDRETIYLAEIAEGNLDQATFALTDARANRLASHPEFALSAQGHPALRGLCLRAIEDNGLSVPTAGSEILGVAKTQFEAYIEQMLTAANTAANRGQHKQADEIARNLLTIDPRNSSATKILEVAFVQPVPASDDSAPSVVVPGAETNEGTVPGNGNANAVPGANSTVPGDFTDRTDAPNSVEEDAIQRYKNRSKAAGEKLSLEVQRAIEQARSVVVDDPDAAISILKGMQGNVRIAADIDDEIQRNLLNRLLDVEQQVRAQREQLRNQRIRLQQELAEQEARRRVIEGMQLEEERLEQLIDQVRALLDDGFHGNPSAYAEAEAVAEAAVELVPFSGVATQAQFTAEAAGQLEDARYLRALRADRFLETLTQVEFSHVPFPDEPPIRYPPAPVWKALTERRSIWKSVDLKDDSAAERRIRAALEEETELQFVDTPLVDAIGIIGELHNINIRLDLVTLDDEGISSDEPVNIFISGIRLKSALKIMLEQTPTPVALTWVIEDEVMKITTVLKAEEALENRVYPVTDLVIPVQQLQGGGGLGGFGGGGGGQFGGGGGQFGGGGGGGGQFGGGNFFSIPPAALPAAKKNQ
ncbi:MAG: VWA domain-containing protein [Planctomycetaceae bacterium]|nr:VWA domain-containing protein [Planctomycetaceae bacterium]